MPADARFGDKSAVEVVTLNAPIFIYADMGDGFNEVTRGTIQKIDITETNKNFTLDVDAADECIALRHSQDDFYFTADHSSTAILEEIFSKWGVPHEIHITDVKHDKKVYRNRYLSDMVADVLKDLKEKGGGVYFVRARGGVIEIIERGTNDMMYQFDTADNLIRTQESFDITSLVTRVQVVGKQSTEGKQRIDATIDGKTQFGVRQIFYVRDDKTTLEEATKAAQGILDEQGDVKHKVTLESPDIPTLRKGDRIRVKYSSGESYFFVKAIRHNAASAKMTLDLDEDKDKNAAFDTARTDESNSSAPP